jgi:hypothetical protein
MQRGELVVGTTGTQPPLNTATKAGNIIGLDAAIARLMHSLPIICMGFLGRGYWRLHFDQYQMGYLRRVPQRWQASTLFVFWEINIVVRFI